MYYSKKGKSNNNYVVLKHPLRQFGNMNLFGVKFCAGYGVVVKDSKVYFQVVRSPIMKKCKEFPISYLKTAGFRIADVRLVFGSDIYYHYLESLSLSPKKEELSKSIDISKELEESIEVEKNEIPLVNDAQTALEDLSIEDTIEAHKYLHRCTYVDKGVVCKNEASHASPSGYCFGHVKYDSKRKGAKASFGKGKEV